MLPLDDLSAEGIDGHIVWRQHTGVGCRDILHACKLGRDGWQSDFATRKNHQFTGLERDGGSGLLLLLVVVIPGS